MSKDAILGAIDEAGRDAVRQKQTQAELEIARILAEAHETAVAQRNVAYQEALAPLDAESTRRRQKARVEAANILAEAHEQLVTDALANVRRHLSRLRSTPIYPDVLHRLMTEAVEALRAEDGPVHVSADPRDRDCVLDILPALGLTENDVAFTLTCWGGIIASTLDGQIMITNTLEQRYEQALPELRQRLAAQFAEVATANG